jgi:hypothetical protein
MMCRLLKASKAGYYAWRNRASSQRAQQDQQLTTRIKIIHRQSRETYGSPRIHAQLQHDGIHVGRKRIARLMRKDGVVVRIRRRFRVTTTSRHKHPIAPNLLARRFAPDDVAAIDRVYASDITYIDTMEGWLYLAVILDHSLRRISRQRWRNTGRIATFPTTKNYSEPLVSGSHRLSQSQRGKRCASALRLKMAPSSSSRPRIDRFEHRIRPRDAHASLVADLLSCFPMEAMARERLLNDSSKELPSHHPFKREIPSC